MVDAGLPWDGRMKPGDNDIRAMLAASASAGSRDTWLALASKALGGRDPNQSLAIETLDGIKVRPLYERADVARPAPALVDGRAVWPDGRRAWDIRQLHASPDAQATNAAILEDLAGGVTSITLRLEAPGQFGLRPRHEAIAAALEGVHLDMISIGLEAGEDYLGAAQSLAAIWQERGIADGVARGAINADPLGALARVGVLEDRAHDALQTLALFAAANVGRRPGVRLLLADGRPYHNAGASEAEEIAAVLATAVAYARALEREGVSPAKSFSALAVVVGADADQFLVIAKLRALRSTLARVLEASGVEQRPGLIEILAETSERMLARHETHVNMLRNTIAVAAAAFGGADAISVLPHTWSVGQPDGHARRMARNTQIILQEEACLDRVTDPAAGSWYVESLTDALAARAWELFQDIERRGGMEHALLDGIVQERIARTAERRAERQAGGREELIGMTGFADLGGASGAVEPHPVAGGTRRSEREAVPLTPFRDGAQFEDLRARIEAAAAAHGAERPGVTLVCLGRRADHGAREGFMRNLLGAAGIACHNLELAADGSGPADDELGAAVVCICGSDADYAVGASEAARRAKAGGAGFVMLAGKPGAIEGELAGAGVEAFVHARSNRVEVLSEVVARLLADAGRDAAGAHRT
ncbi:MAG: methylmalonyl-CoA mutase [Rhizobiales bacterium]|nr:methylmalonyl-CoA mutase [Hyphomicrobiales bacterium]